MSFFEILACPICKVKLSLAVDMLQCSNCNMVYPVINGIPVIFPGGAILEYQHEAELHIRESYDPWVHRVILQSLLDDQIVLDIGAGNMALDDPNIIRMDVMMSPYVDLVADVHHLPFLPESIDYIFSLAVFEHLHNPFLAAQEIFNTLKDGGYIYHECNFLFAYHGYPHHYFNASLQGMEQVFEKFVPLRKGVAPYQMPSFALEMNLYSFLRHSRIEEFEHGSQLAAQIRAVLNHNLREFDIYFDENSCLNVAAGTYFAGRKEMKPGASLIPAILRGLWETDEALQTRFPDLHNLTIIDNILVWMKEEGWKANPLAAQYLSQVKPFNKHGQERNWDRSHIKSLPYVEPKFGAIDFGPDLPLEQKALSLISPPPPPEPPAEPVRTNLFERGLVVLKNEGIGSFLARSFQYLLKIMIKKKEPVDESKNSGF